MNNQLVLCHHGIKGQRWGVRRYQNEDGSLTAAGKKREEMLSAKEAYKTAKNDLKSTLKSEKQSSDDTDSAVKNIDKKQTAKKIAKYSAIGLGAAATIGAVSYGKKHAADILETVGGGLFLGGLSIMEFMFEKGMA